jgi:preprotein translocase subunit Sss1
MEKEIKDTKRTKRSLSFQEQLEKIAYIHYVVCRKMTWKEYSRINKF